MKKLISLLISLILILSLSLGIAENNSFNEIVNSRGVIYTTLLLYNSVPDDKTDDNKKPTYAPNMVNNRVNNDKDQLELSLYRLTKIDTEETLYAVELSIFTKKTYNTVSAYIEYEEIPNVIKTLSIIKDYMEKYGSSGVPNDKRIYYFSLNGIKFYNRVNFTTPTLRVYFDDDNYFMIENIEDVNIIINYLENVDNIIENNKEYK